MMRKRNRAALLIAAGLWAWTGGGAGAEELFWDNQYSSQNLKPEEWLITGNDADGELTYEDGMFDITPTPGVSGHTAKLSGIAGKAVYPTSNIEYTGGKLVVNGGTLPGADLANPEDAPDLYGIKVSTPDDKTTSAGQPITNSSVHDNQVIITGGEFYYIKCMARMHMILTTSGYMMKTGCLYIRMAF